MPSNESLKLEIGLELAKYFTNRDSYIEISFIEDEGSTPSFKIRCGFYSNDKIDWRLNCLETDEEIIRKYWNIKNPTNILIYIDSNKHFVEDNISYNNISISGQDGYNNLLIDTIINPEKLFSNIYDRLIKDYLKERLVPAKPRRDLYFILTKLFLKELLPQVHLSNFTGNYLKGQFILLGKASKAKKYNFYDIRNFSSGEKVLFYTMLFIIYVQEIGMLVIDEPENHFHEELLVKFIKTLTEISNTESFIRYIKKLANNHKIKLPKEVDKIYGNYSLSQVFLLTHSKNLIYNNFPTGLNYYVDNSLKRIEYNNYEKTLREIGISSIYPKVLFVEGSTESDFFDIIFNDFNIKTHPLNGCEQVVDTFKKLNNIKEHLIDTHFLFIIDKDTRSNDDIKKIESQDPAAFKNNFIVLDRHEFENYFLDSEIYDTMIKTHKELLPTLIPLDVNNIRGKIKGFALNNKDVVFRKHLQKLNGNSVSRLNEHFRKRDIPINTESDFKSFVDAKMIEVDVTNFLKKEFEANYKSCTTLYDDTKWEQHWLELCDGKIVLKETIAYFSKYLGVTYDRFVKEMKQTISKGGFEINKIINELIKKFEITKI